MKNPTLSSEEVAHILALLKARFLENHHRHEGIEWDEVEARLMTHDTALFALNQMELSGGEPDVILQQEGDGFVFVDFSPETPKGRRNCAYDEVARISRKKFPPQTDAVSLAKAMGVELLNEVDYRMLQSIESVDLKTSSWIKTPKSIRDLGGALFCDCRYKTVFTYHNGADSYYGSRGFRTKLVLSRT